MARIAFARLRRLAMRCARKKVLSENWLCLFKEEMTLQPTDFRTSSKPGAAAAAVPFGCASR
jgi:hypothetical protein